LETFKNILYVGFGGLIGSMSRFMLSVYISKLFDNSFPIATMVINIIGSALIGIIFGLFDRGNIITPELRLFLATGFCGGFTTFSTFSYELMKLIQDGEIVYAGTYIILSVVFSLFFCFLFYNLTKG
jgi:CrcB protein